MQMEAKTGFILVSENCSKFYLRYLRNWVAALILAVTFVIFSSSPSSAFSIKVLGFPEWQERAVSRSLNAIAQKISNEKNEEHLIEVFKTVSNKLFVGYELEDISFDLKLLTLRFRPKESDNKWNLEFTTPHLKGIPLEWFKTDLLLIEDIIKTLINGLPIESLVWCDVVLKEEIEKRLKPVLPGWKPSFVVFSKEETPSLEVSFSPELPVILAFNPSFISNSLPTLLHGDIKEDLMKEFSLFIGVPVSWAQLHDKDINQWAEEYLRTRGVLERTLSTPKAEFRAAPVSKMDVKIESRRYSLGAWAAVYAGTKEKSAEFGLHIGKRITVLPSWILEVYGEGIIQLQDWSPEGRVGAKWSPWGDVWVGGEWSSKDNLWWGRVSIDPRLRKPYAWVRIREDGEVNTALGWKATEYISFEVYYDSRDSNMWGLKILGNL